MQLNLRGRKALVTGANSGVGLELTKALLEAGAEVVALVRSDFADASVEAAQLDRRLRVYRADVADWSSLKQALNAIKASETALDLLFNNAGVAFPDLRRVAGDLDGHFAVNTVAPFLILEELGPLLERGTLKTVVQTSSIALRYVRGFSLQNLEHPTSYQPIVGPYGASKLALTLWTREAAASWQKRGIRVVTACPGGTKTKMTAKPQMLILRLLSPLLFHSAAEGARRLLLAAFADSPAGSFHAGPRAKVVQPRFVSEGPVVWKRLQALHQQF